MNVLVTGSSGHVGGEIANSLALKGHTVFGVSRTTRASLPPSVTQYTIDLASNAALDTIIREVPACEAIVHAAANMDKGLPYTEISVVNGGGTKQMLALAKHWEVSAFVYISGVAVIGKPCAVPITEDHPANPLTAYHASKLDGERLVSIAALDGMRCVTLRLSSPSGPGTPKGRILRVVVAQALRGEPIVLHGAGGRKQNYVDVRDVAAAVEDCLKLRAQGTFNIAAPDSYSNRALAERSIGYFRSASPIQLSGKPDPEESDDWTINIDRAREQIAYAPAHTLESSMSAIAQEIES